MGADLLLSPSVNQLLNKEDCFYQLAGKQIAALMDIVGDIEGKGCLLVNLKDAIRLGGTLIMLPPTELDEVVRSEEYNEETKDSYGEIANIIAGSYTKVFEEMYPDNCRFVRKEHDILLPMKVDIDSDEPVPNQMYYQASSSMQLDGVDMGSLVMIMPAETFGIEVEQVQVEQPNDAIAEEVLKTVAASQEEVGDVDVVQESTQDKEEVSPQEDNSDSHVSDMPESSGGAVGKDVEKQRKRIDGILEACQKKISEEVGALLGVDVKLTELDNRPVTKEDFFYEETSGKQVLAHMEIIDEEEDKSYLFIGLKDAIRIGGILIMLPPNEIEVAVSEDDFSVDAEDAYGEIANIISGVYTSVFQEQYSENIRFVKTNLEEVAPMKVTIETDEPISDQLHYLNSSKVTIDEKELGKVHMLFPLAALGLESLTLEQKEEASETTAEKSSITAAGSSTENQVPGKVTDIGVVTSADILIIGDDDAEVTKIVNHIKSTNLTATSLTFKDNVNSYITDDLKVVFLVMTEVNEQSFGAVIKVSSACSVPLVAAGPGWTRTKVIKAVKYGVNDILLTPATDDDIKEKIEGNMVQLAA